MCPIFVKYGSIFIGSQKFFILLGFLLGAITITRIDDEFNLGLQKTKVALFHFYMAIAAVIGSQAYHFIETLIFPMPGKNGHTYYGGMFSIIIYIVFISKMWKFSVLKMFDLACISTSLMGVGLRIGCFLNGCCRGRNMDSIFLVKYPVGYDESSPSLIELLTGNRWDEYLLLFRESHSATFSSQLCYSLGFFLIFIYLYIKRSKIVANPGYITNLWLFLHGILRLLIEFTRDNPPYLLGRFNLSCIISLLVAMYGLVACYIWKKHELRNIETPDSM